MAMRQLSASEVDGKSIGIPSYLYCECCMVVAIVSRHIYIIYDPCRSTDEILFF